MITISVTSAVLLYSTILFIGAVLVWFFTEFTTSKAYRVLEKQNVWRCAYCAFTYLETSQKPVTICPRCGSHNTVTGEALPHAVVSPDDQPKPRRNPSRRKRPGARRRRG